MTGTNSCGYLFFQSHKRIAIPASQHEFHGWILRDAPCLRNDRATPLLAVWRKIELLSLRRNLKYRDALEEPLLRSGLNQPSRDRGCGLFDSNLRRAYQYTRIRLLSGLSGSQYRRKQINEAARPNPTRRHRTYLRHLQAKQPRPEIGWSADERVGRSTDPKPAAPRHSGQHRSLHESCHRCDCRMFRSGRRWRLQSLLQSYCS